jgi:hypothetical protein
MAKLVDARDLKLDPPPATDDNRDRQDEIQRTYDPTPPPSDATKTHTSGERCANVPPQSSPIIHALVHTLNDYLASPDPSTLRRRLLEILLTLETDQEG